MEFKIINSKDKILEKIIELADRNSKTLGHLPKVVYYEYAKKGGILTLINKKDLVGYCLFRKTKKTNDIKIAQLLVSNEHRGHNYSKIILDKVKELFKNTYRGIGLNCRRDYENATKVWQTNGFVPAKEKRSKSKEENYLIHWYYSFNHKNLFSQTESKKIHAVLDINMIIKYRDLSESSDIEVKSLFNSIYQDEVEFYYVGETQNEINRDNNHQRRNKTRENLQHFLFKETNFKSNTEIENQLSSFFNLSNENEKSDRRQIAQTISSLINIFITMDEGILNKRDKIYSLYPINIYTPTEFLLTIDQLLNEDSYISNRFAGSNFEYQILNADDFERIIAYFVDTSNGEKKTAFKNLVKNYANKESCQVYLLKELNQYSALLFQKIEGGCLYIEDLRIIKFEFHYHLFKQFINDGIKKCIENQIESFRVNGENLDSAKINILKSFNFNQLTNSHYWSKRTISGIYESNVLYNNETNQLTNLEKYNLERKLYPIKLSDLDIKTFIIPIKPYWASQLFDYHLANESIFGSRPSLLWNRENVYYRSIKPNIESTPARILWYSSSDKNLTRTNGIIGCSYLDDIDINDPKSLFNRYKKYGVYTWENVSDLAKNNPKNEIKVLTFTDTEVFKKIVLLKEVRKILEKNHSFQGPISIPNEKFLEIYKYATNR